MLGLDTGNLTSIATKSLKSTPVGPIFGSVSGGSTAVSAAIKSLGGGGISSVAGSASKTLTSALSGSASVSSLTSSLNSSASGALSSVGSSLSGAMSSATNMAQGMAAGIAGKVSDMASGAVASVMGPINGIMNTANGIMNTLPSLSPGNTVASAAAAVGLSKAIPSVAAIPKAVIPSQKDLGNKAAITTAPAAIAAHPQVASLSDEVKTAVTMNVMGKLFKAADGSDCEAQIAASAQGIDPNDRKESFDVSSQINGNDENGVSNMAKAIAEVLLLALSNPQKFLDLIGLGAIFKFDPKKCKNKKPSNKAISKISKTTGIPKQDLHNIIKSNSKVRSNVKRRGVAYQPRACTLFDEKTHTLKKSTTSFSSEDSVVLDDLFDSLHNAATLSKANLSWLTSEVWIALVKNEFNLVDFKHNYKGVKNFPSDWEPTLISLFKMLGINFPDSLEGIIKQLHGTTGYNPIVNPSILKHIDWSPSPRGIRICPTYGFKVDQYIEADDAPMITPDKVANLKKVYETLILPIYNYYQNDAKARGTIVDGFPCNMIITRGLMSVDLAADHGASIYSPHIQGRAVNFILPQVNSARIVDDIVAGKIELDYGVVSVSEGVHITLPFEFEGKTIRRMFVEEDVMNLSYKFL